MPERIDPTVVAHRHCLVNPIALRLRGLEQAPAAETHRRVRKGKHGSNVDHSGSTQATEQLLSGSVGDTAAS